MAQPADRSAWGNELVIIGPDFEDAWGKWPGRNNAPSVVGINRTRFRELVSTGQLTEYKAPDGTHRYRPEDLASLRDEFAFEETTQDPQYAVAGVQIEGMKTANDVLKLQMGFNERMTELMFKQQEAMVKSLVATIETQNKAIEFYQRERLTYIKEQSETKIQELVIGIEANQEAEKEERRKMLVAAIAPHIAPVLGAVVEAIKEGTGLARKAPPEPPPAPQAPAASDSVHEVPAEGETRVGKLAEKLLRSVGPEKLGLLKMSGMLEDEDSEMLSQIIGEMGSAESSQPTQESE